MIDLLEKKKEDLGRKKPPSLVMGEVFFFVMEKI